MGEFLLALIYFLLAVILSIIIIPILCICEVFRQLLTICLSVRYKQWIQLVNNFDTNFLLLNCNAETIINPFLVFQSNVNLEEIKTAVKNKWTDVKLNGQYKHPLLRRHIIESCGYFFWSLDKNFSIDDHVRLYGCKPPKNQNELNDLFTELWNEPLPQNKSPWLLLVFPLDDSFAHEPRYVIFSRFHHCLSDGVNLNRMMSSCFLDEKSTKFLPSKPGRPFSTIKLLTTLYYFPKFLFNSNGIKTENLLRRAPNTGKGFVRPLKLYSIARVKKVAKATGATINDVMISCVAGAMKKHFSKYSSMPLRDIDSSCPVSMPGGSQEPSFKNRFSSCIIPLALSENTALKRLKSTQKFTSKLKELPFYYFNYLLGSLILNRLPAWITSGSFHEIYFTCSISNAPLQQNQCTSIHGTFLDCNVFPPLSTMMGIAFGITSFNGSMQLTVAANDATINKKDVNAILESFIEELEELEKSQD